MNVIFAADEGEMNVEILEKEIELDTKYGKLIILMADVRRVELSQRILPAIQTQIDDSIQSRWD